MIRENKLKYLISSALIILPSIVALFIKAPLGGMMRGAWFFTWLLPLILLLVHTGLLILTRYIDHVKQNKKIENIIFFTIPTISLYTGAIFIAIILGLKVDIGLVVGILMGVGFIIIGNYMPKAERNRTFGVKLKWTVANDDNWNATHRLAGKLFVVAGIISLITAFLPSTVMFIILTVQLVVIVAVPTVYSYLFYKKAIETGSATEEDYATDNKFSGKTVTIVAISILSVVIIIGVLVGAGGLKFDFTDDALLVEPTFGGGIELNYSELEDATIEYRDSRVDGTRVMGYGSATLLYGHFVNDEFGNYTRYTYTRGKASIVIYTNEGVIVIADKSTEETRAIYDELVTRVNAND